MSDKNNEITMSGQVRIELICICCAVLLWIILVVLGILTGFAVFFYGLLAYHIIGGLLSKNLAKNMVSAILLAPIYVGRKIAMYVQIVQVENKFNELTNKNLVDLNHSILDYLKAHPGYDDECMGGPLFGYSTYGDLRSFNQRIIDEYNSRKEKPKAKSEKSKLEVLTEEDKKKLAACDDETLKITLTLYNNAVKGDANAMMLFALNCQTFLEDPQKAFYWMKKSADAGDPEGMYWLSDYYGSGYGVKEDKMRAVNMLMNAAEKGHELSIDQLKKMGMSKEEMRNCGIPV